MIRCLATTAVYLGLTLSALAQGASCRNPVEPIRRIIGGHIATLQEIELEASRRIAGEPVRSFEALGEATRGLIVAMNHPNLLAIDRELSRCRNAIPPVRQTCAAAASLLEQALASLAVGILADPLKRNYSTAMSLCERWMRLAPPTTALRFRA